MDLHFVKMHVNVRFGYRLVLWWNREAAKYRYLSFDAVEPEKKMCCHVKKS
jgi:hypothetical protein